MPSDPPVELFRRELDDLTKHLLGCGLVDDYQVPARRTRGDLTALEADYWYQDDLPVYSKITYSELHAVLAERRAYDFRFLDGGLVQLRFEFESNRTGSLVRSRLAYLPSPDLTPFQESPDTYLADELFGDVVDLKSVTVPIRFDYDTRPDVVVELHHPVSHVTLGQYPHCRIAAAGAITPYYFIELILRSFYRTADHLETRHLPPPRAKLPSTITNKESQFVHFGVPVTPSATSDP